jgi:hypothetical protein
MLYQISSTKCFLRVKARVSTLGWSKNFSFRCHVRKCWPLGTIDCSLPHIFMALKYRNGRKLWRVLQNKREIP